MQKYKNLQVRRILRVLAIFGVLILLSTTESNAQSPSLKLPWPSSQSISVSRGYSTGHPGIDFDFDNDVQRDHVTAAASGQIVEASSNNEWNGGYGNFVKIYHGNNYYTLYAHLDVVAKQSGRVAQGEIIGEAGNTGNSTGDHLHFELRMGSARLNPVFTECECSPTGGVSYVSDNFLPAVLLYDLPNYNASGSLWQIREEGKFNLVSFNNKLSSVQLPAASDWTITLYEYANQQGGQIVLYESDPDLSNNFFIGSNTSVANNVSSVQIVHNGSRCILGSYVSNGHNGSPYDQCTHPTPTPTPILDGSSPTATPAPTIPADAWRIDYYNDIDLNGPNDSSKCHSEWTDASSYFFKDWGDGSPGGSCNEQFSARIRRHVNLATGQYDFALFADDNARIEVLHAPDDNLVVDQWWATQHYESKDLPEGDYEISIVYRDTGGRAIISAWWSGPDFPAPPRESRDPSQWYAEFWPHQDWFWDPFITFNDGNPLPLNKDWGHGSIGYGLQSDNFSSKYTRTYQFECGDYRFDLNADDYGELDVVDPDTNQSVHHLAVSQANTTVRSNPPVRLAAKDYEVRVKHKEYGGAAKLYLDWTKVSSCATPTPAATVNNTPIPTSTFTPTPTPISMPPTPVFGSGRDGDLFVDSGETFTFCERPPTACTFITQPAEAGSPYMEVSFTAGLTVGDEIVIMQLRGDGAGQYEFANIAAIGGSDGKTLTLDHDLLHTYVMRPSDPYSRVQVVKVPHFNSVTVQSGATLNVIPWDGIEGGVIAMRVANQLVVQGTIDIKGNPGPFDLGDGDNITGGIGAGFAGGKSRNQHQQGYQGEGDIGGSYPSQSANGTGGGGGNTYGTANSGAGGGGGSHATAATSGTSTGQASPGEGAQGIVGNPEMNWLFFGGGGGGGSMDQNAAGGPGGAGGGIAALFASQITIQGSINANGGAGGYSSYSGGGGGAGGSVLIKATDINVGTNLITAIGGTGGSGSHGRGGNGGNGRIRIEYGSQFSGSTEPMASVVQSTSLVSPVTPTNTPVSIPPVSSTDGELITSWEVGAGTWHVGDGGVIAEVVAQHASDGTNAIKLSYSGSPTWSYFQFNFPATMDLDNYDKLQIHVINPGAPLTMGISIPTGNSWAWHESPTQELPHGSKLMEFDLKANNWTSGSNVGPVANINQAQGIVVLLDGSDAPNAVFVDNLRRIGQAESSTPTPTPASELIESWEVALGEWPYTNGSATGIERVQANASDGNFSVKLSFNGPWSHFQYNFPQTINLAVWDKLQMHVVNDGEPMNVKIVLLTGDTWAWHTSSLQPLPSGEQWLEFSLSGNNWEKDGVWGPLTSADQVKAIVVIIEGDNYPSAVYVDSIKVIDADT